MRASGWKTLHRKSESWPCAAAWKVRSSPETNVSQDFEELLESFNDAGVRYLIGGAHALALHARPRATKDLGLFVAPTKANARRLLVALGHFLGGSPPSYVTEGAVLAPIRSFNSAWRPSAWTSCPRSAP